jgi:hypothetical protein
MRALLCLVAGLLLGSYAWAQEKAQPPSIEIPAEYKAFFDDYAALVKKHPEAASRFGMFDRASEGDQKAQSKLPRIRSFACPNDHCCGKWISQGPGNDICVLCFFCPP